MTNIIVHGFVSNKLITQGYHAGEAPTPPTAPPGIGRPYAPPPFALPIEVLRLIKEWLELKVKRHE